MRDKPSAFAKATADKPVFLSCTLFSLRGAAPRPYPSVPAYGRAGRTVRSGGQRGNPRGPRFAAKLLMCASGAKEMAASSGMLPHMQKTCSN